MFWYELKKGEAHGGVFDYVQEVERAQIDVYERFAQLAYLYDPSDREARDLLPPRGRASPDQQVSENVVARNVDSALAQVAMTDIRSRYVTVDGDWAQQRLARHLEWYVDGLVKRYKRADRCRRALKDCILKGPGFVRVDIDWAFKRITVDRVQPSDVIVDEAECRSSEQPRQMHYRKFVSRQRMRTRYPKEATAIDAAQRGRSGFWNNWAGYRPIDRDELVAIESWYLPDGEEGDSYYEPGRHTICLDGVTLLDEEWSDPDFPIERVIYSDSNSGYYGIGGGYRVMGHQFEINRINWQSDQARNLRAFPTTFIRPVDAQIAIKSTNRMGTFAIYKGDLPKTVIPPAVSDEHTNRRLELKASSFEEFGQGRLQATGMKPAGLDSGAALREYKDQASGNFAPVEKAWEALNVNIDLRMIRCCKKLGKDAPTVTLHQPVWRKEYPLAKG
jgi:hypothetical protein